MQGVGVVSRERWCRGRVAAAVGMVEVVVPVGGRISTGSGASR